MTDPDPGTLVQAGDLLKDEGISSELRSIRSQSGLELQVEAVIHACFNLPAGAASREARFIYYLYVRRGEFARAKDLLK